MICCHQHPELFNFEVRLLYCPINLTSAGFTNLIFCEIRGPQIIIGSSFAPEFLIGRCSESFSTHLFGNFLNCKYKLSSTHLAFNFLPEASHLTTSQLAPNFQVSSRESPLQLFTKLCMKFQRICYFKRLMKLSLLKSNKHFKWFSRKYLKCFLNWYSLSAHRPELLV